MEIRRAFRIASLVGVAIVAAPRTGLAAGTVDGQGRTNHSRAVGSVWKNLNSSWPTF